MQLDRMRVGLSAPPGTHVQEFDENRKPHRDVDVAFGDVLAEAFQQEGKPDQQQEAQGEHLQGGVAVDEAAYGLRSDQHDQYGDRYGGDHHGDLFDHAHGGGHRVEREDHVDDEIRRAHV